MKTNVKKWMINGVYVISAVLAGIYILINILTLAGTYGFEYYGYDQWPWFYQSPVTLVRFTFTEIVVMVLCLYAMKKYHKTMETTEESTTEQHTGILCCTALMSRSACPKVCVWRGQAACAGLSEGTALPQSTWLLSLLENAFFRSLFLLAMYTLPVSAAWHGSSLHCPAAAGTGSGSAAVPAKKKNARICILTFSLMASWRPQADLNRR